MKLFQDALSSGRLILMGTLFPADACQETLLPLAFFSWRIEDLIHKITSDCELLFPLAESQIGKGKKQRWGWWARSPLPVYKYQFSLQHEIRGDIQNDAAILWEEPVEQQRMGLIRVPRLFYETHVPKEEMNKVRSLFSDARVFSGTGIHYSFHNDPVLQSYQTHFAETNMSGVSRLPGSFWSGPGSHDVCQGHASLYNHNELECDLALACLCWPRLQVNSHKSK